MCLYISYACLTRFKPEILKHFLNKSTIISYSFFIDLCKIVKRPIAEQSLMILKFLKISY